MPNDTPAAIFAARDWERRQTGDMILSPDIAASLMQQIPTYKLYIFNVGPIEHVVQKGSAGPAGGYKIGACKKGEAFWGPLVLPSIITDTYMLENEIKTHSVSGEFMCQDIVHPMIGRNWSFGQNLDELGVFWTKNNPPSQDDLEKARVMLEQTFRRSLAEANQLEAVGDLISITPVMRHAADYFEEDRQWNRIYRKTTECPGCLGPVKPGAAIHTCGAVIDWDKAIKLGLKTRAQAKEAGVELNGDKPKPAARLEIPEDGSVSPEFAAAVRDREEKDLKELGRRTQEALTGADPKKVAMSPPVQRPAAKKKPRR